MPLFLFFYFVMRILNNLHGFSFISGCSGLVNKRGFISNLSFSFFNNKSIWSFSSNPVDTGILANIKKLVINSTSKNVVFNENGQVILMFTPLKAYEELYMIREKGKIKVTTIRTKIHEIVTSLSKLIDNLESGYYRFEFYLYVSYLDVSDKVVLWVYIFDPFNKDCLLRVSGSYGCTINHIMHINLNDNGFKKIVSFDILASLPKYLTRAFEMDAHKKILYLNKETLLVITKLNKDEYDKKPL